MATSAPALGSASAWPPQPLRATLMSAVCPARGLKSFSWGNCSALQPESLRTAEAVCDGKRRSGSVSRTRRETNTSAFQKQNNAATRRLVRKPYCTVCETETREKCTASSPMVGKFHPGLRRLETRTASAPGSNLQCNAREEVGILRQAKPMVACKYGLISLRYTRFNTLGGISNTWMASGLAKRGTDWTLLPIGRGSKGLLERQLLNARAAPPAARPQAGGWATSRPPSSRNAANSRDPTSRD